MRTIQSIIRSTDVELKTSDTHKLHGYFGNIFEENLPLLHPYLKYDKNRTPQKEETLCML